MYVGYVAFTLICVLGVLGNFIVITTVLFYKAFKNNQQFIMMSRSFVDILVSGIVIPISIHMDITNSWIHGWQLCVCFIATDIMSAVFSVISISMIITDMTWRIAIPNYYRQWMTKKRSLMLIVSTLLMSIFLSYGTLTVGAYYDRFDPSHQYRLKSYDSIGECTYKVSRDFSVISASLCFWIPTVIVIILYVRLYTILKRDKEILSHHDKIIVQIQHRHSLQKEKDSDDKRPRKQSNETPSNSELLTQLDLNKVNLTSARYSHDIFKQKDKTFVIISLMMGLFFVCWLPYFVNDFLCLVLTNFCETLNGQLIYKLVIWLGYFNSVANPYIYIIFDENFKHSTVQLAKFNFTDFSMNSLYLLYSHPLSKDNLSGQKAHVKLDCLEQDILLLPKGKHSTNNKPSSPFNSAMNSLNWGLENHNINKMFDSSMIANSGKISLTQSNSSKSPSESENSMDIKLHSNDNFGTHLSA